MGKGRKKENKRKMLYLHAKWCGPCKDLYNGYVSKIVEAVGDQVEEIDVEVLPTKTRRLKVNVVPTLIMVDDQLEIARFCKGGYPAAESIIGWLRGEIDDFN